MAEERIFMGLADEALIIRPVGHITASLCPELKARVMTALGHESKVRTLAFDLSGCSYMDSTFLGLIVFMAKTVRGLGLPQPAVHGADAPCMSLFRTMGMMRLLHFSSEACAKPRDVEELIAGEALSPEFLLDVHKELSALSSANKDLFRRLTSSLEDSTSGRSTSG